MKVFLGTSHGVRQECYGWTNESFQGTGQGNMFSGSVCRDVSYFTFKEMKNKKFGIIITSKRNNKEVQRVVIDFVYDGNFAQVK